MNVVKANLEIVGLYNRIVDLTAAKLDIELKLNACISKVKDFLGDDVDDVLCVVVDDDGQRPLFEWKWQSDYYILDQQELKEMAPMIYQNHQKLVKGAKRFSVKYLGSY